MSSIIVKGSNKLEGEISVQGSKNSILPILAATILCRGECVIHSCPKLSDVEVSIKILNYLGCIVKREEDTLIINTSNINRYDIPNDLMREMRSSIVFLGSIISRFKKARLSFPGGCELGPRPIDIHLKSLRQMGVNIVENHGVLECEACDGLIATKLSLSFPSVGATENVMLAAVNAQGTTIITNCAREPEICDLADYLNKCGARICGAGEGTIIIEGVKELYGTEHKVIPDRIVASTFMSAVGAVGGDVVLKNVVPPHFESVSSVFKEAGAVLNVKNDSIRIKVQQQLNSINTIRTTPYPGFPTDAQALLMAVMSVSKGTTVFIENIFENRYKHVGELLKLGAIINVEGRVAVVKGKKRLSGAFVEAYDLRGSASLLIAGLAAEGVTEISDTSYIDRGYENIEYMLNSVGGLVKRI